MMSAVVNGMPSDHFTPGRRWKVHAVPSDEASNALNSIGIASLVDGSARYGKTLCPRCMSPQSPGLSRATRSVPP